MIITKSETFTKDEIKTLSEQFEFYIKTVIDIKRKVCSSGMERHFEGGKALLETGSEQSDIWGGGIDLEPKEIDFNSFINIRPKDNNLKNEIQSEDTKEKYTTLTHFFFQEIL